MNWYKLITSMPVALDRGPYNGYFSVGHGDYWWAREKKLYEGRETGEVIIWGIDKEFNWHEVPARDDEGNKNSHSDLPMADFLASGRYEQNNLEPNGVVSLSTKIPMMDDMSTQRKEFMIGKIEKILDDRFKSPRIVLL